MKKTALIVTTLILLATTSTSLYARGKDNRGERPEIEVEAENPTENKFSIKGQVESIGTNSFVVNGQEVIIDLASVNQFKQKGILDPGDWVKVDGIVKDGLFYATNVMAIGEGQGRFQINVTGLVISSPTPSTSASPTPTESASPSGSPSGSPTGTPEGSPSGSPTATATATSTAEATSLTNLGGNLKIKANGPIELVARFLEQVLAYLQSLLR